MVIWHMNVDLVSIVDIVVTLRLYGHCYAWNKYGHIDEGCKSKDKIPWSPLKPLNMFGREW